MKNMLKRILLSILTFIASILFAVLCIILTVRTFFNEDNLSKVTNNIVSSSEISLSDEYVEQVLNESNLPPEIMEYVDKDQINNLIGDIFKDYINSTLNGETPKIDVENIQNTINEGINNYSNEQGKTYPNIKLGDIQNTEALELPNNLQNNKYQTAIKLIESTKDNRTIYILTTILIILEIIIILLRGILETIRSLSISLISNSIILKLITFALSFIEIPEIKMISNVLKDLIKTIDKYIYITFASGVVLFIIPVILTNIKESKNKEKEINNMDTQITSNEQVLTSNNDNQEILTDNTDINNIESLDEEKEDIL